MGGWRCFSAFIARGSGARRDGLCENLVLSFEILDNEAEVDRFREGWNALSVTHALPYSSPAWMLAWWRHLAPRDARLRIVLVEEGNRVIGVAPMFVQRRMGIARYRFLGADTASGGAQPMAVPGREDEAAALIATALTRCSPRPNLVSFEWISERSPWPMMLSKQLVGRMPSTRRLLDSRPAPYVTLLGRTYHEWLRSRNGRYRRELLRLRRRLEDRGAVFRLASSLAEVKRVLPVFAKFFNQRWGGTARTGALATGVESMLSDVAQELISDLRFRLWYIEVEGALISTEIFVAAGGELSSWQGGYDRAWAAHGPSIQTIVQALRHAWDVGDERLDLGRGGQSFKYRLGDGDDRLQCSALAPMGPLYPLAEARILSEQTARRAYELLNPGLRTWRASHHHR